MNDKKILDRIEFTLYPGEGSYNKYVSLTYEIPADLHISTLHTECRAFAAALGFQPGSINEYFGEEQDEILYE